MVCRLRSNARLFHQVLGLLHHPPRLLHRKLSILVQSNFIFLSVKQGYLQLFFQFLHGAA